MKRLGVTFVTGDSPLSTYLERRGAKYYFRRVVPLELRPYFRTATGKPRAEFMFSLNTSDRRVAPGDHSNAERPNGNPLSRADRKRAFTLRLGSTFAMDR